jgi:hypothetical protein
MNAFKTELYKISFDANDITQIVHIERSDDETCYQSFLNLNSLVMHISDLYRNGKLSPKETSKIISKSADWMLRNF